MEKLLDLKMPGVMELGKKELREVEGGNPWKEAVKFFLKEIVSAIVYAGDESQQALNERCSSDSHIIWADVGHR